MQTGRGGYRQGAGRPKGAINKSREEFIDLIEKVGGTKRLLGKLRELADGVVVQEKTKDGPRIYSKPPNIYAITYLLDQRYGKARQSIEATEDSVGLYDRLMLRAAENRGSK